MRLLKTVSVAVVCFALNLGSLRADVLYSGITDGPWEDGYNQQLAQTFRTGNSSMTLTNVSVWVRNADPSDTSSIPGSLSLYLFSVDGSKKPTGSSLLTIVNNQSIGSYGDGWVGNNTLNYSLSANTDYAVVFVGTGTVSWKYNDGTPITSDINPTPTFYDWAGDGTTWADATPTTGFNMVVNAAVPEPGTLLLGGFASVCGAGAWWARRNKKVANADNLEEISPA